jgi:murein L,D-transpeptidase YcbB/YkuD
MRPSSTKRAWRSVCALTVLALFSANERILPAVIVPGHSCASSGQITEQSLSPAAQTELRSLIDAGTLPDLRWPTFLDYRNDVRTFYAQGGYLLVWTDRGRPTAQATAAINILQQADLKGLSAEDYDASRWPARLMELETRSAYLREAALVKFDVALTVSLMRYISDLHNGRVDPLSLHEAFAIERKVIDIPAFVRNRLVYAENFSSELVGLEPAFPGYLRTRNALEHYLQLARADDVRPLPPMSKTIVPGDSYPGLPQIAQRLRLVGDIPGGAALPRDSNVYQGELVDAVKRFQQRHGLDADGQIGRQTFAELGKPLAYRVRQLQLTLERWRWLPHDFEAPPIVVNIPEFSLRAYDEHFEPELMMKVVVGNVLRGETPVFRGDLKYLIFRPYWNVPLKIQRKELVPKIKRNPSFLEKNGFEVIDSRGEVVSSGAVTDKFLRELRSGKLAIRQRPGPGNSLGLVKFIFPNSSSVYLHGTPETELFSKTRRDFSHGCIRVENPAELAVWALRNTPGWTMDRVLAAMDGDETLQVNLSQSIPVLVVYGTAIVREDGEVNFFEDIYGHDAELEKILEKGYRVPQ